MRVKYFLVVRVSEITRRFVKNLNSFRYGVEIELDRGRIGGNFQEEFNNVVADEGI